MLKHCLEALVHSVGQGLPRICAFFLILFFCAHNVLGQANRASITGTVTDASGGVIVGVDVTAKDLGTNVVTGAVTNADGIYTILNLFPGEYSIEFKKAGFKEVVQPSVTLISTQVAGINVTLQIGAATETVTVSEQAPVLDSENAAIGTNMNGAVVADLPLSIYGGGRFAETFAVMLTPGYSPISNPWTAVINGTQNFTKDYTVDGTSGTASIRGDSMETEPTMEAIQELQAQTSGLDAASAITAGGVMNYTLKSGTNKFHGSLFGYGHNEFLDANTWTNNLTGAPRTKARAWDYGASLGGPILKDKLFFFGAFERYTQNDFTLTNYGVSVPTTLMLNGDFSELLGNAQCKDSGGKMGDCGTSNGNGGTYSTAVTVQNKAGQTVPLQKGMIFDPATCTSPGTNCQQFTGNVIDTPISSVAQKIIPLYQKYYAPEQAGLSGNERFPSSNSPSQFPYQVVAKLDYNLRSNDKLSGSWIYKHQSRTLIDSGGVWAYGSNDGGPLADSRIQGVKSSQFRVSEAHTFSPNVVNVFNETYNYYWNGSNPAPGGGDWASQLGFASTGRNNFPVVNFGGAVNGYGITKIGDQWGGFFASGDLITGDNLTWTKGRHTFSFGGGFWAYQVNSHVGDGIYTFNFLPNTTDGGYTNIAGFGFASFLLGDVMKANQSTPLPLYGRRKALDLFAQDSYKVTSRLTLTAGLRWQYAFRFHEKYGHWANFDLNQIDPKYGYPGKLVFANGGGDSFEKKEYWDGFGPQIGFAYSPAKKWVVRGSFSLTLLPARPPEYDGVPDQFAPQFQGTNSYNKPFNWDSGYPGVFVPGSTSIDPGSFFGLVATDPHALMPAFTDTYNFGVQYELPHDMRLEVSYIGNRGHHLPDTALAFNEPSGSKFLQVEKDNPGLVPYGDYSSWQYQGCTKGGPMYNGYGYGTPYVGLTCPWTGYTGPALAAIAPSPQLAYWSTAIEYFYDAYYVGLPLGQTSYNSMVVDLMKRAGRGVTMDLNYTYSRQRGDTFTAQQEWNAYYTPVQDFSNIAAAANSLTSYDLTHVVKGYMTYQLPFGRGQRWLSSKGGLLNGLVGGWQVSGLVNYYTGQPFNIGVNEPFYPIWGAFYPNFNSRGAHSANPSGFSGTGIYRYFPLSVATAPVSDNGSVVGFGSGGSTDGGLRCPGQASENASVLKRLSFGSEGRYQLSMRVEFYNLFNRHYYSILGCGGTQTKVGDANFAAVTGVNSSPRTGQFGLRFTF